MIRRGAVALTAVLAVFVALAGSASAKVPHLNHVFIITLENENAADTFGPSSPAPYLSQTLRSKGAFLPNYYGIGHESLDNYIAEISGQAPNPDTQDDCGAGWGTEMTPGVTDAPEEQLIGTMYEDQILTLALQGKDLRKLVVREVMSEPLPKISSSAPVERVTFILSHENPAVFVEMDDTRIEILTKYDLMSTVASLMEQKR